MEILAQQIETYLLQFNQETDPLHRDLEKFAARKTFQTDRGEIAFPIVGPLVGKILYQLTLLTQAKRVLELGSGFGYSAYWFAKAMGKEGDLILTDGSRENLDQAKDFLSRMENKPKLSFFHGNALEIIETIHSDFDIIFNDIDKRQYPEALKKALPRIKKGGLLIADNVLWSGEVLNKKNPDSNSRGIQEFNRLIFSDAHLVTTILPVRDGVAVCLKI